MGFADGFGRLAGNVAAWADDVLEGAVGGGQAAVGLLSDIVTAPWNSPETFDGMSDALWDRLQVRFGEMGETAFAPDTGFGAAFRVVPEPARVFTGGAVGALETTGREFVREPLSTAFISANEVSNGRGVDVQRAYDLAQSVSAGQALAVLLSGKDIHDPEEMARFVNTDFFRWTSGTSDALLRMFADADVALGKGAAAGRMRYLLRPIRGSLDEAFFTPTASNRINQVAREFTRSTFDHIEDWMVDLPANVPERAGAIARTLFGKDPDALSKATLLARAPDRTSRAAVWKFLGGDLDQWKRLNEYADTLKTSIDDLRTIEHVPAQPTLEWAAARQTADEVGKIARAQALVNSQPDEWWRSFGEFTMRHDEAGSDALRAGLTLLQDELDWVGAVQQTFKSQSFEPRLTRRALASDAVVRSSWYRTLDNNATVGDRFKHGVTAPYRLLTDMRPHHLVDVDDSNMFGEQVSRMLLEARADIDTIDEFVGLAGDQTLGRGDRVRLWEEAEDAGISSIAREFDLPDSVVQLVKRRADSGRKAVSDYLNAPRSRAYTPDGRAMIVFDDDGIRTAMELPTKLGKEMPIARSQVQRMITPADFTQLRTHLRRLEADGLLGSLRSKLDAADAIEAEIHQLQRVADSRGVDDATKTAAQARINELGKQRKAVTGSDFQASGARAQFREYGGLVKEVAESITYFWRPAVLMRPGWPLRVVMDEQLRMLTKFGAATLAQWPTSVRRLGRAYASELKIDDAYQLVRRQRRGLLASEDIDPVAAGEKAARYGQVRNRTSAVGAGLGMLAGGPVGGAAGAGLGYLLTRKLASLDDVGWGAYRVGQYDVASPFDKSGYYRDQVSMNRDFREIMDPSESGIAQRFRALTDQWVTITGEMPQHASAWQRTLSRQIAQDPLWRQALEGKTSDEMLSWLDTADGAQYLRDIPWRSSVRAKIKDDAGRWVQQTPERWIDHLIVLADDMTLGDDIVKQLVLDGKANKAYERLVAVNGENASRLPAVNGEVVNQMLGKSQVFEMVESFIDKAMQNLGSLPTDNLSRQPAFAMFYQREMERLLDGIEPDQLGRKQVNQIMDGTHAFNRQAREKALNRTRALLYDLAERSAFGEMTRGWIIPFFDAGREVVTRWSGLVYEKPVALAYARKIWEAPEKAGLIKEDPETGEQHLVFRVPEAFRWITDVPGSPMRGATDSLGRVTLSRGAFAPLNVEGGATGIATGGLFGYGPVVQIAASEIVRRMPSLEESFRSILPYGPTDPLRALVPSYVKRALDGFGDVEDNRAFRTIYGQILTTRMVEISTGEREAPGDLTDPGVQAEFYESIEQEARALFRLRTVASFLSPVAPTFESPYRPYIDEYRRMQEEVAVLNEQRAAQGLEPTSADSMFIAQFGEEFFAVTQGFTRSVDAVPPNLGSFRKREEFERLINGLNEKELAGLIVGIDGAGSAAQFSQAVYEHQLQNPVAPGSSEHMREPLAPEEILAGPDVRLGWSKFSRVMDIIEAERISRGLPNLSVKAAQDLEQIRRAAIDAIEQQHPLWAEDRQIRDSGRWSRRISDFRKITGEERLLQRPEFVGLQQYLTVRDHVLGQLNRQREQSKSSRLDSTYNQRLRLTWETAVAQLRMNNPAFANLWYRWLSTDPMTLDTVGL